MLRLLKIILITITLFSMQGEIAETLHFMVLPVGRKVCTFDDLLPCIEKITLLSDEEDRILEAHEDALPS